MPMSFQKINKDCSCHSMLLWWNFSRDVYTLSVQFGANSGNLSRT